jgi:hypothetical protein
LHSVAVRPAASDYRATPRRSQIGTMAGPRENRDESPWAAGWTGSARGEEGFRSPVDCVALAGLGREVELTEGFDEIRSRRLALSDHQNVQRHRAGGACVRTVGWSTAVDEIARSAPIRARAEKRWWQGPEAGTPQQASRAASDAQKRSRIAVVALTLEHPDT